MRKYYAVSFKVKKNYDSVCIGDFTCVPFLQGTQKSGDSLIEVIKGAENKERFYFYDLKKSMFFIRPALGLPEVPFDELREDTMSTLTDGDTVYIVYIRTSKGIIKLYDAKCKLNLEVTELAKAYGLTYEKSIKSQAEVLAKVLEYHFSIGDTSTTSSSDAMAAYKRTVSKDNLDKWFPRLSEQNEEFVRDSVRGAWLYSNGQGYRGDGFSIDRNSQYSYIMRDFLLPYGQPKVVMGAAKRRNGYCYFTKVRVTAFLKENRFAFIENTMKEAGIEGINYPETLVDRVVTMPEPEYEQFLQDYEIQKLEVIETMVFKGRVGMFTDYVEKYGKQKVVATASGDLGARQVAKMKLNGLYGKFLQKRVSPKSLSYPAVGSYVLAYSRILMVRCAQAYPDKFLYCDTDSLHFKGKFTDYDFDENLFKFSATEIGAFKLEFEFVESKHCWVKAYCLKSADGTLKMAAAGISKQAQSSISFDSFRKGFVVKDAATVPVVVPGGAIFVKQPKAI